eukprot:TRINITY_DN15414_c0_g3_i1.p3 TRINITY_DN15414_c0_g3~~TRINITY_DN15414_c0_g3_i1.p3  ORF type:complete len:191 (+),score=59.09 TRINITY_DN15414_c0_g3_i1:3-575(+)
MVMAAALVGFNYGTNLSLFPSATKDYFGLKNFGVNYGLVFTAWGAGGFVLPRVSQMIVAATGSYESAYLTAAVLLIMGAGMTVVLDRPVTAEVPEAQPARSRRPAGALTAVVRPGPLATGRPNLGNKTTYRQILKQAHKGPKLPWPAKARTLSRSVRAFLRSCSPLKRLERQSGKRLPVLVNRLVLGGNC